MPNTKKITVDQLQTVVTGMATKNDNRFRKKTDSIAKTDLAAALQTEIDGKANTSSLGSLASKSEVSSSDLASGLQTTITGKVDKASGGTTGNIVKLTSDGSYEDTGIAATAVITSHQDISGKVSKVAGGTTGNIVKLTADGSYEDTGIAAASVLTSHQDISGKADASNVYTKSEIDARISSVYKPAGSVAFASLPTLGSSVLGNVYNITDSFSTTSDFVEGANKSHPAGTNVVVVDVGTSGSPSYKFDVLAGMIDTSNFATNSDVEVASAQDIQDIVDGIYA